MAPPPLGLTLLLQACPKQHRWPAYFPARAGGFAIGAFHELIGVRSGYPLVSWLGLVVRGFDFPVLVWGKGETPKPPNHQSKQPSI